MAKAELTVLYVAAFERPHMVYMEFKYKALKNKNKKHWCVDITYTKFCYLVTIM